MKCLGAEPEFEVSVSDIGGSIGVPDGIAMRERKSGAIGFQAEMASTESLT